MSGYKRVTASVYIFIICFMILNLIWGADGVMSYQKLAAYRDTLNNNLAELKVKNQDLTMDSEQLITQYSEIKLQARELGYLEKSEGIIQLNGYKKASTGYAMGKILSSGLNENVNKQNFVLISLLIGLIFFLSSTFIFNMNRKN